MKVVIIDDEEKARNAITSIVVKYCNGVEIVGYGESVASGLRTIHEMKPDLVLLDIKMPDGSGFDLLERIGQVDFNVVFVTAYEEYAIKSFEYSALHYLLKPIDPNKLVKVINKAMAKNHPYDQLKRQLEAAAEYLQKPDHRIILKTSENIQVFSINEIVRCEADINYTTFHFLDGTELIVSKTLKEFEMKLTEHGFFRCHKAHLVNLRYIKKIEKKRMGFAVLNNNTKVPVSIRKRDTLMKLMETHSFF